MNKLEYFWSSVKFNWKLFKLAIEQNFPYTYNILKIVRNQLDIWALMFYNKVERHFI